MRSRHIRLAPRDYQVLAGLEKWGVLGLGQIIGLGFSVWVDEARKARLFFNEPDRRLYGQVGYKRLRDLERASLVRAHYSLNFPKVFTLAERGHQRLKEAGHARLPGFRRSISPELVRHEILLSGVGLMMQKSFGLPVQSENERLRRNSWKGRSPDPTKYVCPDLVVWIGDRLVALEVELSQKSERRYELIWDRMASRPRDRVALYLTAWPGGVRFILRLAEQWRRHWIYACDLGRFRESLGMHDFENCRQARIRLDMLEQTLPKPRKPEPPPFDWSDVHTVVGDDGRVVHRIYDEATNQWKEVQP
ncbi:MAG: hypothetical protein ABII00_12310 [Elusimicrobiota bacterium]